MRYECVFHKGTFVNARPEGFAWGISERQPPFEIHKTDDLEPAMADYDVNAGPYVVKASQVDFALVAEHYCPQGDSSTQNVVIHTPAEILAKPLYKYTRRKYADDMVRKGHFKIGTLYEFLDVEKHGNAIGDAGEGRKVVYCQGDEIAGKKTSELPQFLQEAWFDGEKKEVTIFPAVGMTFGVESLRRNLYVYCTSETYSEDLMREFGCDACVEIVNIAQFFVELTRELAKVRSILPVDPAVARCVYVGREQHHLDQHLLLPPLLKPPSYAGQKEVRAIWTPTRAPIKGVILHSLKASEHCFLKRILPAL